MDRSWTAGSLALLLATPACFAPVGNDASSTTTESTSTAEPTSTASTGDPTPTTTEPASTTHDTSTGEPGDPCREQPHIGVEAVQASVLADLTSPGLTAEQLHFTRYLSLVHLHNAGLCDAEIEVHRHALIKLCNSLSQANSVIAPVPVDPERLLYRLDLRDYRWDNLGVPVNLSEPSHYYPADDTLKPYPDRWQLLADQSPYLLIHADDQAAKIVATTKTPTPILRGDAFIDAAARAPLYYDMLGLPRTLGELEKQLALNLDQQLSDEKSQDLEHVARASMHLSPLTGTDRTVERQQFPGANDRALWRTFDFGPRAGLGDPFTDPFTFIADGSELLFNLPNGLHAYMIVDGGGLRQRSVPLEIFSDPAQSDSTAIAGLSCIGCHTQGLHPAPDDLRHEIDDAANRIVYDDITRDQIRNVHPKRMAFAALLDDDRARFTAALAPLDLPPGDEPVLASFLAFQQPLDLHRAAAELGLPPDADLSFAFGMLSADLHPLLDGETVQRADFTALFAASVCKLALGRTRCCPDGPLLPACE